MGQFKALTEKNWILMKRNPVCTVLEILLPIIFILFVLLVRHLAEIQEQSQAQFLTNSTYTYTTYGDPATMVNNFGLDQSKLRFKQCNDGQVVAIAPRGNNLAQKLYDQLNNMKVLDSMNWNVQLIESDDEIDKLVRDFDYGTSSIPWFCFGVSFNEEGPDYNYSLRFNMSTRNDLTEVPQSNIKLTTDLPVNLDLYVNSTLSGLISVNTLVNNVILKDASNSDSSMLQNKIGPIYQEQYDRDPIYTYLGESIQFLVLLPLLHIFLRLTSQMLTEKQKKIRETMSIMGMSTATYYLTWFLRYLLFLIIIHLICSAIFVGAFRSINFGIPFFIFLLFDIVLILQSFFIQTFVTRAKLGVVFALLFFMIQYVLYYTVSANPEAKYQQYAGISIIPHVALILAFRQMLYAQSLKIDLTVTQLLNEYTIATAIVALILNIIFWLLLFMYLDHVFPNQFGAKKHPCFCCFCCFKKNKYEDHSPSQSDLKKKSSSTPESQNRMYNNDMEGKKINSDSPNRMAEGTERGRSSAEHLNRIRNDRADIESVEQKYKEMEQTQKAIIINKLNKEFKDRHAVKDLSMKMYTDQIFVLLGHNGAGKTTTISMLTGMLKPTSGYIEVLGATEVKQIRSKLGLCPQHDTLYEDLTVEEHIRLFATFRGVSGEQLQNEVNKLIRDVNLQQKRQEKSKNLSGGQKRRLSVAMAFSGNSQVILLDEPTSGMDTSARRFIWEMLKNYRQGRVILLTTHFMDEADYLGDRIAIMAGGKLIALGSNIYLKNRFGVGYNITFVKKSTEVSSTPIINLVSKHVPTATVLSSVSSELAMQLPMDQIKHFGEMFTEIDQNRDKLGIQTYGISITTLEEVFLKVGEDGEVNDSNTQIKLKQMVQKEDSQLDEQKWERQDGCCQRFVSHFLATILKRLRVIKRDKRAFIFQLLLPMLLVILALLLMRISFIEDFPKQQLSYKTYIQEEESDRVIVPISWDSGDDAQLSNLKTIIQNKHGSDLDVQVSNQPEDIAFDENDLFPLKKDNEQLKGGIYFEPQLENNSVSFLPFTSIVNTRSPTSFVTVQTLAAQTYINDKIGNGDVSITVMNYPFPRTQAQLQINNTISGFFGAIIFSIALAFKFASVVSFIVKERADRCKHQQIVSGMNLTSYWAGNYLNDLFLYLIVAAFSIGMCKALEVEALTEGDAMKATILLFIFFGTANIPLTYLLGYAFQNYGTAQGIIYFINFVTGGLITTIILVLRFVDQQSSKVGRGIAWPLRIIPAYAFGEGLINMGSVTLLSRTELQNQKYEIFDMEIALAPIIYLIVFSFVFAVFVFVFEALQRNQSFMRFFNRGGNIEETKSINESDVLEERKQALEADPTQYEILTKNLRKVYSLGDGKFKVAVDNLSFGVRKGEVFGLLGINGAGKTTTFKMLAGEIVSTSGESYFGGLKINQNLDQIRKNLGYCPQFDALIEKLTVREQLELYYDMKCLPKKYKDISITRKIKQMNLEEYEDKLSGQLSGGNKRKLSVAIALIGNPGIIFLDEPSTGMDPKARRFMWKIISRISTQRKQSTVILTTHSMEQAEALSTRLGIMVSGNFKCIGTPQHIKSKYGKGFQIQIKTKNIKGNQIVRFKQQHGLQNRLIFTQEELPDLLQRIKASPKTRKEISKEGSGNYIWTELQTRKSASMNSLIQFHLVQGSVERIEEMLDKSLGGVEIIQHFQTYVRFKTSSRVEVGKMFSLLQSKKQQYDIMQYSIKQATVEQIFNKFAEQDENYKMD